MRKHKDRSAHTIQEWSFSLTVTRSALPSKPPAISWGGVSIPPMRPPLSYRSCRRWRSTTMPIFTSMATAARRATCSHQIVGLTRFLLVALRLLTLIEFILTRQLQASDESISGLVCQQQVMRHTPPACRNGAHQLPGHYLSRLSG